ncbi:DNA-directed RNA polymerases I/II/III subunit 10 [Sordaria brevicollis]|uniref:DNA-directed RNA polymerases I, II, and III subunit RPABC5 n=1 Tax=Sordaria brevicollis TaxID=83679 RepID=A0AAE0PAI2_SORBR|nr:DNA-directed RNA polymerases I/II/III subunit 10 [Sordaria brevicollis]
MIIPIRCFSCGKVVGDLWERYLQLIDGEEITDGDALDQLGLKRYCCRRMVMTHVDLIEKLLKYTPDGRNVKKIEMQTRNEEQSM